MKDGKKNKISRDSSSVSIWQEIDYAFSGQKLRNETDQNKIYDCLIIGAGITGITAALLLQRQGLSCAVAEAEQPGFGTTGGTTAHLSTFFDSSYADVERDFGKNSSKLLFQAGNNALDLIKSLIYELKIDCDFAPESAWLYAENKEESIQLEEIYKASKRAGAKVEMDDKNIVPVPFESVIRFDQQAQFHPLKYLYGLIREFMRLGGILSNQTRIRTSEFSDGIHTAHSDHLTIRSKNLIYASHVPPGVNLMSFKNAPYRSYVLALKLKDKNYPKGLIYDMRKPYHYFRTHTKDGEKYLIVGGEDHKTGHEDPQLAFQQLKEYVNQYYNVESVVYEWSAQYYVPTDGLPYIGRFPGASESTYMATGFNGDGMIYGTLSAKIISDLILKGKNRFASLFSPSRIKLISGFSDFIKENFDVAWHFIADRFSTEQLSQLNNIQRGHGKLVEFQDKKLAIYKNKSGKITALNPVCTHAGCIVNFNYAEQSWDCPCHGGRYNTSGKILCGPPTKDLETVLIKFDT